MEQGEAAQAALLGVEKSCSGRRWSARAVDERVARALCEKLGVPDAVGRILAGRALTIESAPQFLAPRLRETLPDPSHLKDMDRAAQRIADAIAGGERIAIFGDYDVDGATAAALIHRYLAKLGAAPLVYVPDRIAEGYGPNAKALLALRRQGVAVVITVDCGSTAHEPLAAARDAGLDVIVADHHAVESALPPAFAVINPNRLDETSPHKTLAAVGVAFLLLVAVNRLLRQRGRFAAMVEPDLMSQLDLVALGTICDVVPLTGLNRVLVAQGLRVMARRANVGIAALADVARVNDPLGSYHAGFVLGPRVNAGGRVGESSLGWKLLATDDTTDARRIAELLDRFNRERQAIEGEVLVQALVRAETAAAAGASVVIAAGHGWHAGVIGIVASRLVERLGRPVCVVGVSGGVGRGSGRSIPGVDLGAAVIAARQSGVLVNGGGHEMAAGFTVTEDRIDSLTVFLNERLHADVARAGAAPSLALDGALAVDGANGDLLAHVERLAPFGVGNPEPRFVLTGVRLGYVDAVGTAHLRCMLPRERGGGRLKAMAFRAVNTPLGDALMAARGGAIHLAGHLRADRWNGRDDVQFIIEDAAPAHYNM